jgi:hypothetical protein
MIKYLAIPLILVGCTAPVTDPPAHACSPRLDGEPTFCPEPDAVCLSLDCPKPLIPRESAQGEIDIWNPHHFIHMEQMFIRNARRNEIEKNMTQPDDAINKALMEYFNGSNGSTKQKELLQLQSDGN